MAKEKKDKENEEKSKLEIALQKLNKTYGEGTVILGNKKPENVESVNSGSLTLDIATGIGGFPYGRVVEIIGPESSGKSSICLHTVSNVQKEGKKAAYIDMEHALDLKYARVLGVNVDELLLSQPSNGEEALNIAREIIDTGEVSCVIIDSVAALVPKAEIDGIVGDSSIGRQARLMSQGLRMIVPAAEKNNCLVIFTNQIRMKIGAYGNPEVGAGGESLKFYSSIRVDMRKSIDKEEHSNKTRVKIIKNKLAPPFGEASFDIVWGKGVNRLGELADLAVEFDIINKGGAWFKLPEIDDKIQGLDKVFEFLSDNPEYAKKIEDEVLKRIN